MTTCKLTIKDWFSNKIERKVIMPKDPMKAAEIHSKNNPNSVVTIEWEDTDASYKHSLRPYNMEVDQLQVDEEEMDLNAFTSKWYGKVSKAKLKEIEEELDTEFINQEISE